VPDLPDKLYFKIGEVAKIVGVEPYVLRYWETEFPMIRPGKSGSKHRLYRRRDIETLLEIKRLLHQERYTIEGAKKRLKSMASPPAREVREQMPLPLGERKYRDVLIRLKSELEELHKLLE
jgi:DNA-binding transcriptional MerR regulator